MLLLASTYANLQSYLRVLAFTYGYLLLLTLAYDLKALTFTYAYLQLKGTHFHFAYYAATYDGIEHSINHYLSLLHAVYKLSSSALEGQIQTGIKRLLAHRYYYQRSALKGQTSKGRSF